MLNSEMKTAFLKKLGTLDACDPGLWWVVDNTDGTLKSTWARMGELEGYYRVYVSWLVWLLDEIHLWKPVDSSWFHISLPDLPTRTPADIVRRFPYDTVRVALNLQEGE